MGDDSIAGEPTSRRRYLRYGAGAIGTTLLAGCAGNEASTEESPTEAPETSTPAETSTPTDSPTPTEGPYEVTAEPYGAVEFESVPETYATSGGAWTDIGFAFGTEPSAMSRLGPYPNHYYDRLPDVTFDTDGITELAGPSKYGVEMFYELDVDVFLMDKILLSSYAEMEASDFETITEQVAPFCASYIRGEWSGESLGMEFSFPYYSLEEAVRLAGRVFDDPERADAWVSLHESFRSDLRGDVPSGSPDVGLLYSASKPSSGDFMVANPTVDGVATRPYRTFDVANAFADVDLKNGWRTDYEGLLEADPEYLFFDSTLSMDADTFESQFIEPLESSSVAGELTAVQEGNIFRGPGRYQGPIINLFQTEILAKQLYPEVFGELSASGDVAESDRLFARAEVAAIINGDVS